MAKLGVLCGTSDWWPDKWCTDGPPPLLPPCLQYIALAWLPFILIILPSIPYYLFKNFRSVSNKRKDWPLLVIARLCMVVTIGCCEVAVLSTVPHLSLVEVVSAVVSLLFLIPVFMLILIHLRSGLKSATPMFYFWLLLFLTRLPLIIRFHHHVLMPSHQKEATISISHFIIVIASLVGFILEWFAIPDQNEPNDSSPEESCSHASILFYSWLNPLFLTGIKATLSEDDVPSLRKAFSAEKLVESFISAKNKMYKQPMQAYSNVTFDDIGAKEEVAITSTSITDRNKINVIKIIYRTFGGTFFTAFLIKVMQDIFKFIIPQLLGALITFVKNGKESIAKDDCGDETWKGFLLVVLIFLVGVSQAILLQVYQKRTSSLGLMARTSLFSEIYRKALSLSIESRKKYSVGEIVNILSTDAQTFNEVIPKLNMTWSMPLQIVLAIFFLYQEIGVSVIAGVFILIVLIPFNIIIGKKFQQQNKRQLKEKDKRIRQLYEIFNGIKTIKLYAWEDLFIKKTVNIRMKELSFLRKYAFLKSLASFFFDSSPVLVTLASFAMYVSIDKDNILTAEKAFVCLTLFDMLRVPLSLLTHIFTEIIRLQVSRNRIDKFLNSEDRKDYIEYHVSQKIEVIIKQASFKWENDKINLCDIDISFDSGKMYAIMGPVGCGKSSLLFAILGQMMLHQGSISINKKSSIAYVSQEAWIQYKTIKENIIFGEAYDEVWYKQVIEACALQDDLDIMPLKDETMIGENGINLSGGQKQRMALARAVYRKADIYLLDDPLSAVDVGVANKLINCVLGEGGLLGNKTRLLVTHNAKSSRVSDYVIHMEEGRIFDVIENKNKETMVVESCTMIEALEQKIEVDHGFSKKDDISDRLKDLKVGSGSAVVKSYKLYSKSVGIITCCIILILFTINQSLITASSLWLLRWSDENEKLSNKSVLNLTEFNNNFYIGVYGGIGISIAIASFIRNFVLYIGCVHASSIIHSRLMWSTVRGTMNFFDMTSTGSIISRFSGDMDAIDTRLPFSFVRFLCDLFKVVSCLIIISFSSATFLAAFLPLSIMFYGIKKIYFPTSRQLQRMESSSYVPLYRFFNETIRGVASIRAFGDENRFCDDFNKAVQRNLKYSYYNVMSGRWLVLQSDLVGNLVVLVASLLVVIYRQSISPGWAGLSLSYAVSITETFNWVIQGLADLENQATVVERIREAIEYIPQEADWFAENEPGEEWPQHGKVTLENYGTRYSEGLDEVLKGLNIVIEPGEKIGVVGRTGAGKSSLTLALFRMLVASRGRIIIDDIDISKIGLNQLRSVITIIPQDSVLFVGTLRGNIDPFNKLTDEEVQGVIKGARLDKIDIYTKVEEDGSNFSAGEKQLICLARALCMCRHSKLVIMDEATASVDSWTDVMIQQTMRKAFRDSTVITIAHRLQTIMDCHRIIVLEQGKVKEFGNPQELALDSESQLYKMLNNSKK